MANNNKYFELAGGAPYHDDFDVKDNFMRILFNPSRAVQARELTQLQTILQHQQKVSSEFLFKDNSIVDGARITINSNKAALITDTTIDNSWVGLTLTNSNTSVPASKQITITDIDTTIGPKIAVYYDYSGDHPEPNESMYTDSGDELLVEELFTAITATCDEGIVYSKNHFIHIPRQEIVVSNNNQFGSDNDEGRIFIGYQIQEDVVTNENTEIIAAEGDETITLGEKLKDPASGSRNFNAIGADRYRVKAVLSAYFELIASDGTTIEKQLTLQSVNYTDEELADSQFTDPELGANQFPIGRATGEAFLDEFETFIVFEDQKITRDQTEPQFGNIEQLLARRTSAESGNYTLGDFSISVSDDPNDPDALIVTVSPGTAFVEGFELNKRNSTSFAVPRARETNLQNFPDARKKVNQLIGFVIDSAEGKLVTPSAGVDSGLGIGFRFGSGELVDFKNDVDGNGDTIAQGRIHSVERKDTTLFVYFSNIGTLSDTLSALRSFKRRDTDDFMNVSLQFLEDNQVRPKVKGSILPLLTRVDQVDIPESIENVQWQATHRETGLTVSSGQITLTPPADAIIEDERPISLIFNETTGQYLDPIEDVGFANQTSRGAQITISIDGSAPASTNDNLTVDYLIQRKNTSGGASNTFTRTKELIEVEKTFTVGESGINDKDTIELLLDNGEPAEDVYEIVSIVQVSNVLPELADNYDPDNSTLSDRFFIPTDEVPEREFTYDDLLKLKFDDGQTDEYYGPGKISGFKKFWSKYKNTNTDSYLTFPDGQGVGDETKYKITYRYFKHNNPANAAFTVNSYTNASTLNREFQTNKYLIPSYKSPKFGRIDLIGCIDFRRKLSDLIHDALATPTPRDKVVPNSTIIYDIKHNFGRLDSIDLNKDGKFIYRQGIPSQNPDTPEVSGNSMRMYNLYVPPTTFTANDVEVEELNNTRYTMKDIGRLETRIERLENSVSLNLLEKSTFDMKITDSNGSDRFKSGIFVDNFEGLSHTNSSDEEFYIAVDRIEKVIQCPVHKANVPMKLSTSLNDLESNDIQTTTNKIKQYKNTATIAPTGERILAQNDTASSFLNLNPFLFYTWVGSVELDPAVDTWHEERYLPIQNVITGSWEPPEGFNPNWVVDDVDTKWIGIDPEPSPEPPPTNPPNPSNPPSAPRKRWQIEEIIIIPHLLTSVFSVFGNPNATQSEIDREVERASSLASTADEITGDGLQWLEDSFLGEGGLFNVDTDASIEERQRVFARLVEELEFRGELPTSANLGSNEILSSSRAKLLAQSRGEEEFNKSKSNFHEENSGKLPKTHEVREDRITFQASDVSSGNRLTGSSSSRYSGKQKITTTKVKDVLKKNVEKVSSDRVIDKSSIYWMRPRMVEFNATGLRPGMRVFAAMDNQQVSIKPNDDFIDNNGDYRVNGDGEIKGWFRIPSKTFTTGIKTFLLMDAAATSQATSEYESSGTITTRQKTITTIRSVEVNQIRKTTIDFKPLPYPDPPEVQPSIPPGVTVTPSFTPEPSRDYADPIAQSFLVTTPGGCMLKSVELFFATKAGDFSDPPSEPADFESDLNELFPGHPKDDPQEAKAFFSGGTDTSRSLKSPVSVYLVKMRDGSPTSEIVPMSHVTLRADQINRDFDNPQDGKTEFEFNDPIYLEENEEYALIVASSSKEYNLWVSRLGEQNIYEGRDIPGKGIATQPYLGSIFKSQNSFTWTPDQDTTLTFKLKRYTYPVSSTVFAYIEDSKLDDVSNSVTNNALDSGRPLYLDLNQQADLDQFEGDIDQIMTRVATMHPMIGALSVPETEIAWEQAFADNPGSFTTSTTFDWIPMQNNKRNRLINDLGDADEYIVDNNNSYIIRGSLKTDNQNLSPIIDLKQLRGIASRNQVIGIEPFFGNQSGAISYQQNTAYDQFDLLKDPTLSDPNHVSYDPNTPFYFVVPSGGISPTGNVPFQDHLNAGRLRELNLDINLPGVNGVTEGNAGVYVSNTINLKDSADDIRLTLESSESGSSFVKPYYKLLDQNDRFVTRKEINTDEPTHYSDNVAGLRSKITYAHIDSVNNLVHVSSKDIQDNRNEVQINGLDADGSKIFFTGVSRESAFNATTASETILNDNRVSTIIATHSSLFNNEVERVTQDGTNTIPVWEAGTYDLNDIVYLNGAFWSANGYVVPEWVNTVDYNQGDRVRLGGTGWVATSDPAIAEEPGASGVTAWIEVADVPHFPTGVKPSDGGKAWNKIPTAIIEGASDTEDAPGIQINNNNEWRPFVLRGSKLSNNEFTDGQFHETEWVPRSNPGVEFKNFQIKLELVARNSKVNIPKCRNVRVVTTI